MRKLLQKLMARFDPGCSAISRAVSDSLDRPLSLQERWSVSMHMLICGFCRRYSRQLHIVKKLASDLDRQDESAADAGPAMSDQARERIRKALESSDRR